MAYLEEFGIREVALDFMNQEHEETAELISRINKTILQIEHSPHSKESILSLLNGLLDHKIRHFEKEELCMLSVKFPALSAHKQEHHRLIIEVRALIDHWKHYNDIKSLTTYMHEIFPLWLKSHCETMDHASAEYIISQPS